MTDISAEGDQLLWYEHLDFPLTPRDAQELKAELGLNAKALGDPDEWVLGHRFVGAAGLEAATVLYLTRRLRGPGVRFDLRTVAAVPPDTAELHAQVKDYIRYFTPVFETQRQLTGDTDDAHDADVQPSKACRPARSVVVDYRAQQSALGRQDVALARAHIAPRMDFEVPSLISAGLSGNAHVDLSFPPAGGPPVITVGLGFKGWTGRKNVRRVQVRAAIGDREVVKRFSAAGMATVDTLDADPGTDLLHLTFEVKS